MYMNIYIFFIRLLRQNVWEAEGAGFFCHSGGERELSQVQVASFMLTYAWMYELFSLDASMLLTLPLGTPSIYTSTYTLIVNSSI